MAGGGSVHVWGRIHHGGKTGLVVLQNSVNGDRYIDNRCKQSLSHMLDNASEEMFCFSMITLRHTVRV
jgi:hypothetical protein